MTQSRAEPTRTSPTRRQVLRGGAAAAVGVGAAATLSACAGGGRGGPDQPISTGQPQAVPMSDVPMGTGVILDENYVVTQPAAGDYRAFTKQCPHQGCNVSLIRDGSIVCACHTSLFSIDDGTPISGPARRGLSPVRVVEEGDTLLVG